MCVRTCNQSAKDIASVHMRLNFSTSFVSCLSSDCFHIAHGLAMQDEMRGLGILGLLHWLFLMPTIAQNWMSKYRAWMAYFTIYFGSFSLHSIKPFPQLSIRTESRVVQSSSVGASNHLTALWKVSVLKQTRIMRQLCEISFLGWFIHWLSVSVFIST